MLSYIACLFGTSVVRLRILILWDAPIIDVAIPDGSHPYRHKKGMENGGPWKEHLPRNNILRKI